MKTKITTLILSLITSVSFAQLTFVKDLNYSTLIEPNGYELKSNNLITNSKKFIGYNPKLTKFEFDILFEDFTIYKTIKIDTAGWGPTVWVENVFFSDNLINKDDKIEISYILGTQNQTTWELNYSNYIINEDGIILYKLENKTLNLSTLFTISNELYIIIDDSYGNKKINGQLFKLGGIYPCFQCNITNSTNPTQSLTPNYAFKIFPNPTDGQLNIESDLNETNMQIKIYSVLGQLLKTESFFTGSNSIDVSLLPAGTYVINITCDKGFLHSEKFVKN